MPTRHPWGCCAADLSSVLTGVPVAGAEWQPITLKAARRNFLAAFERLGMVSRRFAAAAARSSSVQLAQQPGCVGCGSMCSCHWLGGRAGACSPAPGGRGSFNLAASSVWEPWLGGSAADQSLSVTSPHSPAPGMAAWGGRWADSISSPSALGSVARRLHLDALPPSSAAKPAPVSPKRLPASTASLKADAIEAQLLVITDRMLQGDQNAIWGCLYALCQHCSEPGSVQPPCSRQLGQHRDPQLLLARPSARGLATVAASLGSPGLCAAARGTSAASMARKGSGRQQAAEQQQARRRQDGSDGSRVLAAAASPGRSPAPAAEAAGPGKPAVVPASQRLPESGPSWRKVLLPLNRQDMDR